jgi:hypothetical protein|tara:strand:- start:168 stop:431 length:264 start_codon:yes stop_codon:yes gene_type:complete
VKITKRQLKRIIREAIDASHSEIVTYLSDRARSYHNDPALAAAGTFAIKSLLQDDFMDDLGHMANISHYKELIDELSQSPGVYSSGQ